MALLTETKLRHALILQFSFLPQCARRPVTIKRWRLVTTITQIWILRPFLKVTAWFKLCLVWHRSFLLGWTHIILLNLPLILDRKGSGVADGNLINLMLNPRWRLGILLGNGGNYLMLTNCFLYKNLKKKKDFPPRMAVGVFFFRGKCTY